MTGLVQGFTDCSGQEVATKLDPLDVMRRIVDALDPQTGLKDEDGSLKRAYPGTSPRNFWAHDLRFDAATIADVACYRADHYRGRDLVRRVVFHVDAILDAVRAIPRENAGDAFHELRMRIEKQRNEQDGRQTDFMDAYNWNRRMEIARAYGAGLSPASMRTVTPAQTQLKVD